MKLAVERLQREYGARSLALTTDDGNVASVCAAAIVISECRERSVVMTQAFTCMLAGMFLLADGATGSRNAMEIGELPSLIERALPATESIPRAIADDLTINRFFFLGSGAMKGLADECALKMTEMALETAFS